jgi:hypothetical protein
MNTLSFVFAILLILSFASFASLNKQEGARSLSKTFLGHTRANRAILKSLETEFYQSLASTRKSQNPKKKKTDSSAKLKPIRIPKINPECSRLNLYPLIGGIDKEPILYEWSAKLLKTFYGASLFDNKPYAEKKFLDALLVALQSALESDKPFALEKLRFKDEEDQRLYYRMLKGTKEEEGYPSILDYICVRPSKTKICLFHAHPNLLSLFFTPKAASKIYEEMHKPNAPWMSRAMIERYCADAHAPLFDHKLFELLDIGQPQHKKYPKSTLVGEDRETGVSLRKNITTTRPT